LEPGLELGFDFKNWDQNQHQFCLRGEEPLLELKNRFFAGSFLNLTLGPWYDQTQDSGVVFSLLYG
jgi:hypothetical protein